MFKKTVLSIYHQHLFYSLELSYLQNMIINLLKALLSPSWMSLQTIINVSQAQIMKGGLCNDVYSVTIHLSGNFQSKQLFLPAGGFAVADLLRFNQFRKSNTLFKIKLLCKQLLQLGNFFTGKKKSWIQSLSNEQIRIERVLHEKTVNDAFNLYLQQKQRDFKKNPFRTVVLMLVAKIIELYQKLKHTSNESAWELLTNQLLGKLIDSCEKNKSQQTQAYFAYYSTLILSLLKLREFVSQFFKEIDIKITMMECYQEVEKISKIQAIKKEEEEEEEELFLNSEIFFSYFRAPKSDPNSCPQEEPEKQSEIQAQNPQQSKKVQKRWEVDDGPSFSEIQEHLQQ